MKKMLAVLVICLLGVTAQAVVVDDFEDGSLSEYTATIVLDNGTQVPDVTQIAWSSSGGKLFATTLAYDNVEQSLLLRDDYGLAVGQMLWVDTSGQLDGNQDFGIVVAATEAQTPYVRQDYVSVYMRDFDTVYSRGFNGTTEFTLSGGANWGSAVTALFIERSADNTFKTGAFIGTTRYDLTTRTVTNTSIGNAVGFYTDMRAISNHGGFDNLRIVPEPATLIMLGLGGLGLMKRRKA